jgi:threonine dehydrogenase-like Zn-dependent dehydrogenase
VLPPWNLRNSRIDGLLLSVAFDIFPEHQKCGVDVSCARGGRNCCSNLLFSMTLLRNTTVQGKRGCGMAEWIALERGVPLPLQCDISSLNGNLVEFPAALCRSLLLGGFLV